MSSKSPKARKQLLLLVDTAVVPSSSADSDVKINIIYQACCRLLFMHAGFDIAKEGCLDQMTWDYKIFDSNDNRVSLKREPSTFKELKSDKLEKFLEVLQRKIKNSIHHKSKEGVVSPLKMMYTVLASALQDYQWDTPLLMSPLPRHRKKSLLSNKEKQYNAVYLISNKFDHLSTSTDKVGGAITTLELEALFPSAVCTQLQNKNIKLSIVYGYENGVLQEKSKECIIRLQKVLSHVDGRVVPLSSVVQSSKPIQSLILPPNVMGGAYLCDNSKSVLRNHLWVDKDGAVHILQLYSINSGCVVPLFERGPIIFKSLGLASIPPVNSYTTVYTCTGLVPSNNLISLFANGAWEYYMNSCSENKVDAAVSFSSWQLNDVSSDVPWIKKQRKEQSMTSINKLTVSTQINMESSNSHQNSSCPIEVTNQNTTPTKLSYQSNTMTRPDHPILTDEWLSTQCNEGQMSCYLLNLNRQMSISNTVQVLSINSCYGSCDQIALLHPLTPSTSSVSLVKEDHTKDVLQSIITEASPSMTTPTSESSSLSYYPDDCHLLYSSRHQSCDQSYDHHNSPSQLLWSSLLPSSSETYLLHTKEQFSHEYLSNWAHLTPKYGINTAKMEQLKEIYSEYSSNVSNSSSKLLALLKKRNSPDKLGSLIDSNHDDEDIPVKLPVNKCNKSPPSYEDILEDFSDKYLTLLTQEPDTEINEWCKWACLSTDRICQSFPGSCDEMWAVFNDRLLFSDKKIKEQSSDKNEPDRALTVNKYFLQIILHFYFSIHLPSNVLPQVVIQIVSLLRRLALLTTPANVGRLLKDHILQEFSSTSGTLLREVYDELMMPRPSCIDSSDDSEWEMQSDDGTLVLDTENENEDDVSSTKSLESFLETVETKETANPRELRRHASFHRQISISRHPSMKKARSKEDKRKVRRSLFDRSRSFGGGVISKSNSKNDEGKQHNIVVKETPVKKQVENYRKFKLERLRSKSCINGNKDNEVSIVEESPRRTFYSCTGPPMDDEPLPPSTSTAIVFKTPPSKLISPSLITRGGDKKLSSIALSSLFNSPFTFDTPSSAHSNNSQQCKTSCNPPSTPELFGSTNTTPHLHETTPPRSHQQLHQNNRESPMGSKHITTPKYIFGTPPPLQCSSSLSTPLLMETYSSGAAAIQGLDDSFDESASMTAFSLSTPTKPTTTDFSSYIRKLKD